MILVQNLLLQTIHAAAARATFQTAAQTVQFITGAGGKHLHLTLFGVAHPATQIQLRRLALHKPAKPHALHTATDQKM